MPKSKGADFGYLIEQARSQPNDFGAYGSQSSSPADDFSFDFMQGISSMLSVRGKGLLSLCLDDNFVVDDDTTSSSEVPFLSMDLHALSAQLSRLKLSQRLFIEADLLPEEVGEEERRSTSAPKKADIAESATSDDGRDSHDLLSLPILQNDANSQTGSHLKFKNGEMNQAAGIKNANPSLSPVNLMQIEESSNSSKQLEQFSAREVEEHVSQTTTEYAFLNSEEKEGTRFEAATAEAELDMLLDSFSEVNISVSTPDVLINESSLQKTPIVPGSSTNAAVTCIDDSIDALLAETSPCLDEERGTALQQTQTSFLENASLDDSIDDLLAETSSLKVKEEKCRGNVENRGSASKALDDDFDSWLDTL